MHDWHPQGEGPGGGGLGAGVGPSVGERVGGTVGLGVGLGVGLWVGRPVGAPVGVPVGVPVGPEDGAGVGTDVPGSAHLVGSQPPHSPGNSVPTLPHAAGSDMVPPAADRSQSIRLSQL